ncbi:hypothetical protein [Planctobacterium marinum]|uniref:Solute-binding protein family 3/N-terminal domain-containing protein n=1 Tax=Planctobacterium marinum TaxID=1631968 RepID=A0AA48HPH3_9ALTE|nr:hypothetical protein MACH26_40970 [Planctobacterium marinum]
MASANPFKSQSIQYFGASGKYAFKNDYFLQLLEGALASTEAQYGAWKLSQFATPMNQSRAIDNMAQSCDFDIQWHMTTSLREEQMRPIRIPLYKGLYGYRALMVHVDSKPLFADIDSLEQLQQFLAGQGHDWPDTGILKHNGFNVQGVNNYHGLFDLLVQKRIDYFPRSVAEIGEELTMHAEKPLLSDTHILLYYPAPIYFFVCKQHDILAKRLEEGLKNIIQNGLFDEVFNASGEYQSFLKLGGFSNKIIFELENPLVSKAHLPQDKHLWLVP